MGFCQNEGPLKILKYLKKNSLIPGRNKTVTNKYSHPSPRPSPPKVNSAFQIRNLISDFGVLIAIVSLTLLTYLIGLEVPSLKVPASIRVSFCLSVHLPIICI